MENNLGKCVFAPVDVYLGDSSVVQPDIIFIANANAGIIKDGKVKGAPDLIVEVLSGNKTRPAGEEKLIRSIRCSGIFHH